MAKISSKINKEWHEANKMPKNPTLAQRVAWHEAHAAHCKCRPIPPNLLAVIEEEKNVDGSE